MEQSDYKANALGRLKASRKRRATLLTAGDLRRYILKDLKVVLVRLFPQP